MWTSKIRRIMKIVLAVAVFISHVKETYEGRANELNNSKNSPDPRIFLPIRTSTHNDNSSEVVALLHNVGFSNDGPTTNSGTLDALVLYGTSDSFIEIKNENGQFTGDDAMCWLFYIYYETLHTNAVLMSYEGEYGGFTLRLTGHRLSAMMFDNNGVQRVHEYTQNLTSSAWNFIGTNFNKLWDDDQFDLFAFNAGYDKNRIDTIGFGAIPPEVLVDAKGKIRFGQGSDGTGSFQGRMSCFQFYNVSMIAGALKDAIDLCDPNVWINPSYSVGGTFDAVQTTVSMTTIPESTAEYTTVPPTTEETTTEVPVSTNQATTTEALTTTLQQTTEEPVTTTQTAPTTEQTTSGALVTTTQTATTEALTSTVPQTTEQTTSEALVTTTQSATTEALTSTVPQTTEQTTSEALVTTTQSATTEALTSTVPQTTEQTTSEALVTTTQTATTEALTSTVPQTTEQTTSEALVTTTQSATTEALTSTVPQTTEQTTSEALVITTQCATTEALISTVPPKTEELVITTQAATSEILTSFVPPTTTTQTATTEALTSTVPPTTEESLTTTQAVTKVYTPPIVRCLTFEKIMVDQMLKNPLFSQKTTTMNECIELCLKDELCVVIGILKNNTSVQCSCGSNSDVTGISGGYEIFMLQ